MAQLQLRRVTSKDIRLIWDWANDPMTRQGSFNQRPIPWDDHQQWFDKKCQDQNCVWYMAVGPAGNPVAQVRFDITEEGDAVASVTVAAEERGKGYGTEAIKKATEALMSEMPGVGKAVAYIRQGNEISQRAFNRAGYAYRRDTTVASVPATEMVLTRTKAGA